MNGKKTKIDSDLLKMLDGVETAGGKTAPAWYWQEVNRENLRQLERDGFGNFKRTITNNYFTWSGVAEHRRFLEALLPRTVAFSANFNALMDFLNEKSHLHYLQLSHLLAEYVFRNNRPAWKIASEVRESAVGNPVYIHTHGIATTQDMLNTTIEYTAFASEADLSNGDTILEIGAGYGRMAYLVHSIRTRMRYIIADVPPALWVAQKYLSEVFPNLKISKYRQFKNFKNVKEAFTDSNLIFLTPDQLALLPDKFANFSLSVSSFQEMPRDQVRHYVSEMERLTTRCIYLKQYRVGKVKFDGKTTDWEDYDIRGEMIFSKSCPVQPDFMEKLVRVE